MKYFFSIIFFFISAFAFSQDAQKSKFSAGLNIGYKTACGLGLIVSYHANRVVQVDLMAGYTRYNGAKFAAGGKIYPFKPRKVNPFVSACYSISLGADVKAGFVAQQKEHYRTFSNQYIVSGIGITLHGEETSHSLQIGYSVGLNTPQLQSYASPTYQSRDKVANSLKGGFMATYNLFICFNKPRRR